MFIRLSLSMMSRFLGALLWLSFANVAWSAGGAVSIAVMGPLTTSSNSFGVPQLQGVTLAVQQFNDRNIDKHRFVRINIFDDQSKQDVATNEIAQIEASDAVAMIGPSNSGVALAVTRKLNEDESDLPVISPMATATELSGNGSVYQNFFRANVSDRQRLRKLLGTVFDRFRDPSHIVLVYEDRDSYGEGLRDDARSILSSEDYPGDRIVPVPFHRNLSASDAIGAANDIIQKGVGSKSDVILVFGITSDAVALINAINKSEIRSKIFFNEPDENEFKTAAEQHVDLHNVQIVSVYYSENPIVNRFGRDFKRVFGDESSKAAALAYDATNILLDAIERGFNKNLDTKGNLTAFRQEVLNTLHSPEQKDIDFVVPGAHQFYNGEFHNLQFFSLTYDSKGKIIPVQIEDNAESVRYTPSLASIIFSSFKYFILAFLFVAIFAYIGSILREYSKDSRLSVKHLFFSLNALVIDPLVAIITFLACVTLLFIFKQEIFLSAEDNAFIILAGSAVIGVFSGYLGPRSLNALTDRFIPKAQGSDASADPSIKP